MTTTMYFIFGVTIGAIPIMILWYRCDKDLKLVDNFTFTEKQKSIIKEIINLYYVPEDCDICNRYKEVHKEIILEPPFKNCSARKDIKALKEARESNEQMFEEIEKIIRR
ncbi:MAG: hypothetical protein E7097_09100 [Bacteroides sp.]|nr:hypothetical protein [Bacteroides sp.]